MQTLSVEANLAKSGQTKITIANPICTEDGDLELSFHGSFLPIPSYEIFSASVSGSKIDHSPGELVAYQKPDTSEEAINENGEVDEEMPAKEVPTDMQTDIESSSVDHVV